MVKKYSINWEDDIPVSFEVDGVKYNSLDEIYKPADRRKLEAMLDPSEFDDSANEFEKDFDKQFDVMKAESKTFENLILGIFLVPKK